MGEIRIVRPGKTPGYPYLGCKKMKVDRMFREIYTGKGYKQIIIH